MHCSVAGCTAKHYGKGYCLKHYKRIKKNGTTDLAARAKPTIKRYLEKVLKSDGCWKWLGAKTKNGYGVIRGNASGKPIFAHRFSYAHFNGCIPDGLLVLHKCDNPECTNPDHLFVGTQKDNVHDMMAKGRKPQVVGLKGQLSPRAKLTWDQVREIKKMLSDGIKCASIARKFYVTPETISAIKHGKTWKE